MTTLHAATPDIASLALSLRQQVAESRTPQPSKGRRKASVWPTAQESELHTNLLSLLELVEALEEPAANGSAAPQVAETANESTVERMLQALDHGLAEWQSKVTLAYTQSASQELADYLKTAELLSASLQTREERLEGQRQKLEQRMSEVLQRDARTSRQRTAIAQTLRAQRAEMLLELETRRQTLSEQIRQELLLETDGAHSDDQDELRLLRLELEETRERLKEVESSDQQNIDEQNELIIELEAQVVEAAQELTKLRDQLQSPPETPLLVQAQAETIAELHEDVSSLEQQVHDLHQQNSDLAAQIAKQQVLSSGHSPHVSFQQESLSWEERKQLIMQQLEDETEGVEPPSDEVVERQLGIEQVLLTTQAEIEKRDREIAELRTIIEQQSDTRQGVAIGAAAFAQAFDNDEVIQQERQKLKQIQHEWEDKLRQAEIDVSLERAKLARERSLLETELESTKREKSATEQQPEKTKKRKWLEHLGLRDDCRGDK